MKVAYIVGSLFAVTVGIGATLAVNAYFSLKSDLASAQQSIDQQAADQQATAPNNSTVQPAPTQLVAASPTPAQNFEDLSMCDQLDAVAKSGKSVAQFIASSGRYSEFSAHVTANCNWNAEQLKQANAILNPPVITVKPKIIRPVVIEEPSVQPETPKPHPNPHHPNPWPWNNCNGIREVGESYSVECHESQAWNDRHPNAPKGPNDPDQREEDDFGKKAPANGWYVEQPASEQPTSEQPTSESEQVSSEQTSSGQVSSEQVDSES